MNKSSITGHAITEKVIKIIIIRVVKRNEMYRLQIWETKRAFFMVIYKMEMEDRLEKQTDGGVNDVMLNIISEFKFRTSRVFQE